MHQGRVIPSEFIGFSKSQTHLDFADEVVTNHQELMSNFFAQPDALAIGKDRDQLRAQNTPDSLVEHKYFPGDRPSLSMLFSGSLTAFSCGVLLALYEHRVAVEGYLYDCNSFDQWGVELGKVLAKDVRNVFASVKKGESTAATAIPQGKFNEATHNLMQYFLNGM
jgi:glucose-6-phosphate isomerase